MAEITPTNSPQHSGASPEGKPVSSPEPQSTPSLFGEIVDTVKWFWEILFSLLLDLAAFGKWCGRNPLAALALAVIAGALTYFFGFYHPFAYGEQSVAQWSWQAWDPKSNQSHGRLVLWIALGLMLYHRDKLKNIPESSSKLGLIPLFLGILFFILSVRSLNPRMALTSVPFLLYGGTRFVWGREAARILLFPFVFLFFMVPVGALEQATNNLQFIITGTIDKLSHLFGIAIVAIGTTLRATDGTFNFEIAEGCSGIRSLVAMTMLTAVFVHLTQNRLWKKLAIFSCSLVFAIIGNIGRIFTVVLVAKYYDPKIASGIYHDNSGYVFFTVAIVAMLFFAKLVNLDFKKIAVTAEAKAKTIEKKPTTYDY